MTGKVKRINEKRKGESDANSRNQEQRSRWGWLNSNIVLALIGAVGVVLAAVITYYLNVTPPTAPILEVDSVTIQSDVSQDPSFALGAAPSYGTLDFKVRNTGNQLAFITGIRITVKSINEICSIGPGGSVPVSATYGFAIPLKEGIFTAPVSEEVASGRADRFDLNVSLPKGTPGGCVNVYQLGLALVFDQNDSVSAGSISLTLPS